MRTADWVRLTCALLTLAFANCAANLSRVEYGGSTYSEPSELIEHCVHMFMDGSPHTNNSSTITAGMEPQLAASELCAKRAEDFGRNIDVTRSFEYFIRMFHEISEALRYLSLTDRGAGRQIAVTDKQKACEHLSGAQHSGKLAKAMMTSADVSDESVRKRFLEMIDDGLAEPNLLLGAIGCLN